jgi:hypothetical protein
MLETLAEMVERDATADTIDSTVVRAHHCAVGEIEEMVLPQAVRREARTTFDEFVSPDI